MLLALPQDIPTLNSFWGINVLAGFMQNPYISPKIKIQLKLLTHSFIQTNFALSESEKVCFALPCS